MAPEGTPVIAAAPGTVEKLFFSKGGGGITDLRPLARPAVDLLLRPSVGLCARASPKASRCSAARSIGRVGHTGNANAAGPHLHFAINRMAPGERWWQGTPINPYPLLAGKKASG